MTLIYITIACMAGFAVAWFIRSIKVKVAEARLAETVAAAEREREERARDLENLQTLFRGVSSEVLKESRDEFLKQAGPRLAETVAPLKDALLRCDETARLIDASRKEAYGGLSRQLELLQGFAQQLKDETGNLKNALRSSTVRGRWGEVQLRRVVELSGMSAHCDFDLQVSASTEDGRLRPDMVVRLPGGASVIVDAKAPLDAYFKAAESTNERDRGQYLTEHAKVVRDHMRRLSQKAYWEQFDSSTDLVVMFIPGESFASAALEMDRDLFVDGMKSRVVLATPATLIALLRSFAMGWQQQSLAENAKHISEAGLELYDRFLKFSEHFMGVGANLDRAVKSFNSAVGSYESRVMPAARKLKELGAVNSPEEGCPELAPIETSTRQLIGS